MGFGPSLLSAASASELQCANRAVDYPSERACRTYGRLAAILEYVITNGTPAVLSQKMLLAVAVQQLTAAGQPGAWASLCALKNISALYKLRHYHVAAQGKRGSTATGQLSADTDPLPGNTLTSHSSRRALPFRLPTLLALCSTPHVVTRFRSSSLPDATLAATCSSSTITTVRSFASNTHDGDNSSSSSSGSSGGSSSAGSKQGKAPRTHPASLAAKCRVLPFSVSREGAQEEWERRHQVCGSRQQAGAARIASHECYGPRTLWCGLGVPQVTCCAGRSMCRGAGGMPHRSRAPSTSTSKHAHLPRQKLSMIDKCIIVRAAGLLHLTSWWHRQPQSGASALLVPLGGRTCTRAVGAGDGAQMRPTLQTRRVLVVR